jgi:hypothetical protein
MIRKLIGAGMWDDRLDAKLLKFQGDGLSFSQIAERIGVSRNAAIGRYHRLRDTDFPSEAKRKLDAEAAKHRRNEQVAAHQAAIVAIMSIDLSQGVDREDAITKALESGATLQSVANALGLTRQRIHQIARAA